MFSKGYRPREQEHHVAVISFVQAVYPSKFKQEVLLSFQKVRKRRSESVYDRPEIVSETQSRNLAENAEIFIKKVQEILTG